MGNGCLHWNRSSGRYSPSPCLAFTELEYCVLSLLLSDPSVFDWGALCATSLSLKHIALFTAGLPDMAMSALVNEQIEGIAPAAVSMIPAAKFFVSQHLIKQKQKTHSHNISSFLLSQCAPLFLCVCLSCHFLKGGVSPETDQHVLLWAGGWSNWWAALCSVRCSEDSSGYGSDPVGGQACGLQG